MSEPVSLRAKVALARRTIEQDGTGRRLRALCAKPPGVMAGFVEDNWSQKCETLQHGRDFLWTGKEPRIGQRIELNCTAPSDMFFRMSGMLTAVDNSPPPPGVLPPIMPHCHDRARNTRMTITTRRLVTRTFSLKPKAWRCCRSISGLA